ncbi:PqqD family protein [Pseudarthrobacter sp. 1C304]|uniref:PqqD family protein n=1 Tax=Pseudarthrobacter sp. 1C304 TaxID=3457438 RepID=UPI003FD66A49
MDQVWGVSADIACVRSPDGGRVAVLHLGQDVPVILAGTAASVWNGLDGTTTETELIDGLAREYGTDASAIRADVLALLQSLGGRGLITLSPEDGTDNSCTLP